MTTPFSGIRWSVYSFSGRRWTNRTACRQQCSRAAQHTAEIEAFDNSILTGSRRTCITQSRLRIACEHGWTAMPRLWDTHTLACRIQRADFDV